MSEKFSSVIIDIRKRAENAHDLAMDNPDSTTHCNAISAMLTDFIRRLVSAYDSDMDALLVSKNAEIDTLKDQVAQLAEMQNADIQCAKMIELEKSLGAQNAINNDLVEENAELVADLKRLNAQYQKLADVICDCNCEDPAFGLDNALWSMRKAKDIISSKEVAQ